MGVHKAGIDHHAGRVDGLVGVHQLGTDVLDGVVPDEEVGVFPEGILVVAGDDITGIADEQCRHIKASSLRIPLSYHTNL